jgi:Ca2+-binding RTX toxin-like protein
MVAYKLTEGGDYDAGNSADAETTAGLASSEFEGDIDLIIRAYDGLEGAMGFFYGGGGWAAIQPFINIIDAGWLLDYSDSSFKADFTGGAFGDVLIGGSNDDKLRGAGDTDALTGNGGNDIISGGDDNDALDGGTGNDTIWGGAGDDQITGGAGRDVLGAGNGADTLIFATGSTAASKAGADLVMYFKGSKGDVIDLSDIDANENRNNDQDFTFIGRDAFSGHAGELHFAWENGETYLSGDTDGDKKADFTVHFNSIEQLKDEFILG